MHAPDIGGGFAGYGEITRIHPDVAVREALVEPGMAYHAARTAKQLLDTGANPGFLRRVDENFAALRWRQPTNPNVASMRECGRSARMKSLIQCGRVLLEHAGLQDPKYIYIFRMPHGETLPFHQDVEFEGSRSLLLLTGIKRVSFLYPYVQAEVSWTQLPGDVYTMDFRTDESSVHHQVGSIGTTIALLADSDEDRT